jgi:hypothetical protein
MSGEPLRPREIELTNWAQIGEQFRSYAGPSVASWAFRGVGEAGWTLRSSLERTDPFLAVEAERYLLTTFQRRVHHYIPDPPPADDT